MNKRVAWLTDIHLNFLNFGQIKEFLCHVVTENPAAVLISGDIGEAHGVADDLERIDYGLGRPVYFVLGNHDFYYGSIKQVRAKVAQICSERPNLHYLTQEGVHELAPGLGLLGHDGWADGRLGDYEHSLVMMNDYRLISELARGTKMERLPLLKTLGDEAAAHVRRWLPLALEQFPQVLFVTHVPPLKEACWHEGHLSNDEWLPHFACQAVGDALLEIMPQFPKRHLTVLCGHTHSSGECQPLPNLQILTGGAQYGAPHIQRMFEYIG
jgi:Icc protein